VGWGGKNQKNDKKMKEMSMNAVERGLVVGRQLRRRPVGSARARKEKIWERKGDRIVL